MLIKKQTFTIILSTLFLCVLLSSNQAFAQDNGTTAERLFGNDRYGTSVAISKAGWSQAATVIIASGSDYPDALSASSLSKLKDAPILLTEKDALGSNTIAEIKRLKASQAFIIGGTGVIGTGVEKQLTSLGIGVTRIGGTDRYDTSEKVAEIVGTNNGIILASGLNFPDALSIAPISGIKSIPILLSPKDSLSPNIAAFIKGQNIPVSYLVGGTGVLAPSIDSGIPNSKRLSGIDRYATNLSVNNQFAKDLNFNTIYLASGNNFPDALCGAALAAKNNAPIFLTDGSSLSDSFISFIKSMNVQHIVILGANGVVSNQVEISANNYLNSIIHPTAINLDKTSDTLTVGGTDTLTATVSPANVTSKAITWTSSNNAIATVDNAGDVTAVSAGTATITAATSDGGFTAACTVTVNNPTAAVTSISLNKSSDSLSLNETDTLTATVAPANATDQNITWTSSNNAIATVDNAGNVTAVSAGTATITAATSDGSYTATCTINVNNSIVKVTSVSLDETVDVLTLGKTDTLKANTAPYYATNQNITWKSSNNNVATVDNAGNVTALGIGTATITATSADGGHTANCYITVIKPTIASFTMNKTSDELTVSETDTLKVGAGSSNAINQNITWTSSNSAIATVDSTGNVTAVSAGNAIITATSADGGYTTTCNVTVFNPGPGHMLVSSSLVNFTASYEGYSATPYTGVDSQNSTIGYGHVILPGENYTNLTQAQAWTLLLHDLQNTADGVNGFTSNLNLSQQQFDALVDFAYNCGVNGLQGSTLLKDIRANASVDKLKTDFQMWSYCNGTPYVDLYQRRTDEWQIYTSGNYTRDYPTAPSGYV